ncbi:hypothetical protein [Deinococcus xinjiangensis]|uniref:hypothetical protein n=1 Tax=Deinococcus xinjiangensis TaxID=457454 RepID=UPI003365827F
MEEVISGLSLEQIAELRRPWNNALNESIIPSAPSNSFVPLVHKKTVFFGLFMQNGLEELVANFQSPARAQNSYEL